MSIHELQARLKALDEAREARSECDAGMWAIASVKVDEAELAVEQAARRVAEGAGKPVRWPNRCNESVPAALRFLAENNRPSGGNSEFNSEHLHDLASEIERMASRPLYTTPPGADELVEALERLMRALDTPANDNVEWTDKWERIHDAQEIAQRALAQHKENTR